MLTAGTGTPVLSAHDNLVTTLMGCFAECRLVQDEIGYWLAFGVEAKIAHKCITEEFGVARSRCQITCGDDEVGIAVVDLDGNSGRFDYIEFLMCHTNN